MLRRVLLMLLLHEFVQELNKNTGQKKIAILEKYKSNLYIRDFFYLYTNAPKWLLPEGAPPYDPLNIEQERPAPLNRITKQVPKFITGHGEQVNQVKRERVFIHFLESLHPADAELYLQLKEGTLKLKGLKKEFILEVFPHLA